MANIKNNSASQETQRRLLEAAGEEFAERGFHSATIKAITRRAGASLAAVNYHFQDKAELHAAVLRRIESDARQIVPPEELVSSGTAEQRFRAFVRHLTVTMLGRGQPAWERLLLARELAHPTPARASLFENIARPLGRRLSAIVAELTGLPADSRPVALVVASTIAQCIYHLQHQAHLDQIYPALDPRPTTDEISDHIIRFSLAGVASIAR